MTDKLAEKAEKVCVGPFGVARLSGTSDFDYEQFALLIRKKAADENLDWEAPFSKNMALLFTTEPLLRMVAVSAIEELFSDSKVVYYYTTRFKEEGEEGKLKWVGNLVTETQIYDVLEKRLLDKCKIPEVVIWTQGTIGKNTLECLSERLKDVCVPNVRILEINPVDFN